MTKKTSTKASNNKKKTSQKASKKTSKKSAKTSAKAPAKKTLKKAPTAKRFRLYSGQELAHYIELADALAGMEEQVVRHHINEDRHDFANWIRDVFNDDQLAQLIEPLSSRDEIRSTIYEYLVHKHLR